MKSNIVYWLSQLSTPRTWAFKASLRVLAGSLANVNGKKNQRTVVTVFSRKSKAYTKGTTVFKVSKIQRGPGNLKIVNVLLAVKLNTGHKTTHRITVMFAADTLKLSWS